MSLKTDLLKHRILVNRYAVNQSNELQKQLNVRIRDKIVKAINTNSLSLPQIRKLEKQLAREIVPIVKQQINALSDYYKYEARFTSRLYKKEYKLGSLDVPTITKSKIRNIETTFITKGQSKSILESYENFTNNKIRRTIQIVKDAEINNTEKQTVLNQIYNLYSGAVRVQSKTLSLNTILSVMQRARQDLVAKNDSLTIEYVMWTNALDSNVCEYCEGLDGEVFEVNNTPDCPAHANCNCEVVAI